eukprot:687083-Amphidinium_carterae.1
MVPLDHAAASKAAREEIFHKEPFASQCACMYNNQAVKVFTRLTRRKRALSQSSGCSLLC